MTSIHAFDDDADGCMSIYITVEIQFCCVSPYISPPPPLSFFCVWVCVWVCVCVWVAVCYSQFSWLYTSTLSLDISCYPPVPPSLNPPLFLPFYIRYYPYYYYKLQSYNYNTKQYSVVANGRKTGNRVVHFSCFRKFSSLKK